MKSLANNLLTIALGVIKDVRAAYPQYEGALFDSERLSLTCRTRGLGFFSLDLPHLDSLLTEGLETGRLRLEGPLTHAVSKRVRVPRLFSGLWMRVFDKTGCLKQDVDVNAIFFLRQLCCLGKKTQISCSPQRLKRALEEYYDIERELRPPSLNWEADALCQEAQDCESLHLSGDDRSGAPDLYGGKERDHRVSWLLDRVQLVADLVLGEFSEFDPVSLSGERAEEGKRTGFKHGPGAVAERKGVVNKYDFANWPAKLESKFPYRLCGTTASDMETMPINHEVASRLISVPKTAKSPRLIAAEPTEHQWCQQLVKGFMVDELRRLFGKEFICFEEQSLSQNMALRASLDRSLTTIDLSSASDRLSCWTVERIFRKKLSLLTALHAARTRYIRMPSGYGDSHIKLRKFASQGTATTFPVQTLVFLIIALGCSIKGPVNWTGIRKLSGKVRVFGDDIIAPNDRYEDITAVLTELQLKVNSTKSFVGGFFRESCGLDAYKGYDVTPVKPTVVVPSGPSSRQAVLDTSNNLFAKGLWNAAKAAESTLGHRVLRRLPVNRRDSGLTGLVSFCGEDRGHLQRRWNRNLHRYEWRIWHLRSRVRTIQPGERFALLQFFTEAPCDQLDWSHGYAERPKSSDGLRWDPLYAA